MVRKIYIHYESKVGGEALTVSIPVDATTTIQSLLETFLSELQSKLHMKCSLTEVTLKTEEGNVVATKGKNLKTLVDDELGDDNRDLMLAIESDICSTPVVLNTQPSNKIAVQNLSSNSATAVAPIEKSAVEIRRGEVARNVEQIKSLEQLMKKRSYKKARTLIMSNIIVGDITMATPTNATIYAWRCLFEIALNSKRYDDVVILNERLSAALSNHPYIIECSVMCGLALMAKAGSNFTLAANTFGSACKLWQNESTRMRQQPDYVRNEDYFLHITALHAQAAFELGMHTNAASILNSIMDNPRADSHLAVLATYASFTIRFNKFQDTINAVLKAIAIVGTQSRQSPNLPINRMNNSSGNGPSYFRDQEAEVKLLVTQLLSNKEGFDQLIKMFPPNSRGTAEVYAYLASTVKEFSAIDLCIRLYDLALQVQSNHANYTLNLVHAYEVKLQYEEAIEQCRIFCAKNLKLSVGKDSSAPYTLTCAQVVEAMKQELVSVGSTLPIDNVVDGEPTRVRTHRLLWMEREDKQYAVVQDLYMHVNEDQQSSGASSNASLGTLGAIAVTDFSISFTEREMDLLALFATMVKVLFLAGHLSKLPTLIKYIEAVRRLSKISLHQTSIRNEMAYYSHIVQILFHRNHLGHYGLPRHVNAFANPLHSDEDHFIAARRKPIYVCGDSHCLSSAWSTIQVRDEPRLLFPKLVTGIKQFHLRDESQFYTKENFAHAIRSIPSGSDVIFLIGEIDCREGILYAVERDYYDNIEEGMKVTINYFMKVLSQLRIRYHFRMFIHPIPPVLNETRSIVTVFNRIYKQAIENMKDEGIRWLDFYGDLVFVNGSSIDLKERYRHDGTHLNPVYVEVLERSMNDCLRL